MTAVGDGCASCHQQHLVVFAGPHSLANIELEDPAVTPQPGVGLWVTQPVRLPGEPLCCPSATYTLQLLYDPTLRQVDGIDVPGRLVFGPGVWIGADAAADRAPLHSVAVYYALLADGRYEQAWELLSEAYRSEWYYPLWLKAQLDAGVPLAIDLALEPETPGAVRVQVEEVEPESGATVQVYSGIWQTESDNGTWRLGQFSRAAG